MSIPVLLVSFQNCSQPYSAALEESARSSNIDSTYKNMEIATNHSLSSRDARPHAAGLYDKTANKTWITWAGPMMNPIIQEYDHESKSWSEQKIIFSYESANHHDYPTLVILPNGHLLATWCDHNERLFTAISAEPNSIEGQWQILTHDFNATYPLPIVSSSGRVFIFFRETAPEPTDYRPLWYIYSDNNGQDWQGANPAIDSLAQNSLNLDEVYTAQITASIKNGEEVFLLSWTLAGGGPLENRHNGYRKDLYYAEFNPDRLTFTNHQGVELGSTIDLDTDFDRTRVYNSGDLAPQTAPASEKQKIDYRMLAILDHLENPMVFFKERINGRLVNKFITFKDGRWSEEALPGAFQDVKKLGEYPTLLMRNSSSEGDLLSWWTWRNNTWDKRELIRVDPKYNTHVIIENFSPEIPVLSLENDFSRQPRDFVGTQSVQVLIGLEN